MLKRLLEIRHKTTPDAYRALSGLLDDHPLVAPAYAGIRSALAKKIGLGRKPEPPKSTRTRTMKKMASKKKK
jgi:predicted transcriptional regulator